MSFYSKALYRDVVENWKGLCLPYLLSMLALCIIPGVMKMNFELSGYLNSVAPGIVKQVPVITIKKGFLSIDKPEPYIIKDEKTDSPLIIIDTTGQTTSLEGSKALMLVKKDEILVRKDRTDTRSFELDGIDNLVIDRGVLYNWIEAMEDSFVFVLYPMALLFSFAFHFAEILLYAALGGILTRRLKITLTYKALVRLAAIAITPAMVIGAIFVTADVIVPFWMILGLWISIGYLFFAIKANQKTAETANRLPS